MPKMVCVNCHVEFRPEKNGTLVIETTSFGPYKAWDADTWKCPKCGIEVITGFGQNPLKEHYEPDFNEWLKKAISRIERIEYDNER